MEKKQFRIVFAATATVEGDNQADAAAALAIHLSADYLMKDMTNINIHVTREVPRKSIPKAIAEAPYADQVTVEEDGSGLPPVCTAIAEEAAAITKAAAATAVIPAPLAAAPSVAWAANQKPVADEIPF